MDQIKLTQYSHGAGCGCKISPAVLDKILHSEFKQRSFDGLLVGNETRDDAAVYDVGNGDCIVSTTDFFMPIVDDPFTFGSIASVNAISDVYAMGGRPLMAIAILGWPINKIAPEVAKRVLEGSRHVCGQAGIPLAGGHSIDCPEPVFGLAVTGQVKKQNLKRNDTATEGSLLYLTKPLGIGIVTTAEKKGIVESHHLKEAIDTMLTLNVLGATFGTLPYVSALTDVTGFGLLGHLIEMADGSGLSAEISYNKIAVIEGAKEFINQRVFPDATTRNWNSYYEKVRFEKGMNVMEAFTLLPDTQTNGGLLFSVKASAKEEVVSLLEKFGLKDFTEPIGKFISKGEKTIEVKK